MPLKRITLCKVCHDKFYPKYQLPNLEGIASYTATGICSCCKRKTSVKRYETDRGEL